MKEQRKRTDKMVDGKAKEPEKMEWLWVRHGMTAGNKNRRYIGSGTDEGLCPEGRQLLRQRKEKGLYPAVSHVCASPMKRCLETAQLLYPGAEIRIVPDFRECDFGLLENKNHEQLSGLPFYEQWLSQKGNAAFPGGESPEDFCRRSVRALETIVRAGMPEGKTAFVVHGGTIMSVFSRLDERQGGFYDYHVDNGDGYRCTAQIEGGQIRLRNCRRIGEDRL